MDSTPLPDQQLLKAIKQESLKFQEFYLWLEKSMSPLFFEEVDRKHIMLIAHNLMGFHLQDFSSTIHLKNAAIALCLDSPDADLKILESYALYGIKNYQAYVSHVPFPETSTRLRIAFIYFTEVDETEEKSYPKEGKERLRALIKERNPKVTDKEFDLLFRDINSRFLRSLPIERLILAVDMFFRAQTRDNCQYEVRYNENWEEKGSPSMQIVLAWRNTPKHHFLFRLARIVHRHGLMMKRVNATYINPYSTDSILIMALGLHGSNGKAAWDVANIPDFLRELVTVKYFSSFDLFDTLLISKGIISGGMGNFLRTSVHFIHQALVHVNPNLYTLDAIVEALTRHTELTAKLCECFEKKLNPDHYNLQEYELLREELIDDIQDLDTGQESNDERRKNVLLQGLNFIHHILKTNFYRMNYSAVSYRLDPKYLDHIPFDRPKKFPELPFAIFYIKGMHFFGFHIRFKNLARGGLRTVYPKHPEHIAAETNNIFTECYNLAFTQHLKNKDIPEGGAKGVIFLTPYERLESEAMILRKELEAAKRAPEEIEQRLADFQKEQSQEFLYQAQRSYIDALVTLVNCDSNGVLLARHILDLWKKPEYLYLGPDENMHDVMIDWIAQFSVTSGYKPGSSFISGKPSSGINHKEYGVTSLGINVYMDAVLRFMGIDPKKETFTVKMSGGPDGDVAGNQINNLYRFYPKTAKLVAITDISGTIYDPQGLDLGILHKLFEQVKPIKFYPPKKLSPGSFLVDKDTKRSPSPFVQQTLCWKMQGDTLQEDWLSGSEMNHLLRSNVHQAKADVFIPGGGRPRTLNETNIQEFLDENGTPTARAIVEGANLYFDAGARRFLEEKGVIIIKDSSANKTGVICSSFEVLSGLALGEKIFLQNKETLVKEILERLELCAKNEATLLLKTFRETGNSLSEISDQISRRINHYTYQLLDYLDKIPWPEKENDPLVNCFLSYCLPTLRTSFRKNLLKEIPEHHKKAIVACHIGANLVYKKGLSWAPTVVDILPVLFNDPSLFK